MLPIGQTLRVQKLHADRSPSYTWEGVVLEDSEERLTLRAPFNLALVDLGFTTFERGDIFIEFYFWDLSSSPTSNPSRPGLAGNPAGRPSTPIFPGPSARFYNVFQVSSPDGTLKGWYANVALPAQLDTESRQLQYVDLELDVWTHPSGEFVVLDEEEFDTLVHEHPELADAAHQGRTALLELVQSGRLPRWPE